MPYKKDPDEIGALWVRTSASGKDYMTGEVSGVKVVVFRAKPSEKGPAWRVMKSKPKEDASPREGRYRNESKPEPETPRERAERHERQGRPVFDDPRSDDDLGF